MYKIYYDNNNFSLLVDGIFVKENFFSLKNNDCVLITLLPIFKQSLFLPVCAKVMINGGNLVLNIPFIKISENEFYLTPKFCPYIPYTSSGVDLQREFGEHTITVYTDTFTRLVIENQSFFINISLPEKPYKLQEAVLENAVLFYCLCKKHICIIAYDYNDYKILVDKDCDNYVFDEKGISLSVNLNDNQGRIYHAHLFFDGKDYQCDQESFEYTNKHKVNEFLLGYDYLQSLLAGDYDYCKSILTQNCDFNEQNLAKTLEKAQDLLIPTCKINSSKVYVLMENKNLCIDFLTKNGLIDKIIIN